MTTLLLIRHGENEYLKKNRLPGQQAGIHLNERGRSQAAALAESLKKLPIKAIYSSSLERAVETIEPLAKELGLEIRLRPSLMDIHVGEWTGRSLKSLTRLKAWSTVQRAPSRFHFPGGESFLQAQERVVSELDAIAAAHKKGMVAVVFHADPIKLAVAYYLGLPLDNFQRLAIQPASVTILGMHEAGAGLLAMNLIPPFSIPLK
ncbi:MAG TPA: histidine phosphatase family protein [Anaerolineales bacterium]|nr:histidine phosphatase family protein [Anaerolineales bacterium]